MMTPTDIHPWKILAAVGAAFLVGGLVLAYASSPAWAADPITVNTKDDELNTDGDCSLREAITAANTDAAVDGCVAGSGEDTIGFAPSLSGQTITLNSVANGGLGTLPNITSTVTIDGGSQNPTISGNHAVRVFTVDSGGKLNLNHLTVSAGKVEGASCGGLSNSGGGEVTVTNSTFSGNNATISGITGGSGGGICNPRGATLTVTNSTFSENSSDFFGGGITNTGTLTVNNSTFSGNSASNAGGGIYNVSLVGTIKNTIVANSTSGGNCSGTFTDGGYNIDDDASCVDDTVTTSKTINPLLDPQGLQENGGPTKTIALQPTSPAIDAGPPINGDPIACPPPATDQRGVQRPQDGNGDSTSRCDIGAFELEPPALSIDDVSVTEGDSATTDATFTVSLSRPSTQTVTVDYATADGTASAGTDFQSTSGTLSFDPGQTSKTVSVPIIGDVIDEPDETFFVNLTNPTNATISDARGEGTITDDDPPPDTTAPTTTIALTPASPNGNNGWYTSAVHLTLSATDGTGGSGVAETRCVLDPASTPTSFDDLPFSPCPYLGGGADVSADGQHTLYAASKDSAGNEETPLVSRQFKIDTQAPTVTGTFPRNGGEVGPAANIRATFSEDMQEASVKNAFKLFKKGSTNQIAAAVTYDAKTDTATLNPTNNLKRGATYKAVVTTVAKDEAGNRLDQDSAKAGLQQKAWFFEIDN